MTRSLTDTLAAALAPYVGARSRFIAERVAPEIAREILNVVVGAQIAADASTAENHAHTAVCTVRRSTGHMAVKEGLSRPTSTEGNRV